MRLVWLLFIVHHGVVAQFPTQEACEMARTLLTKQTHHMRSWAVCFEGVPIPEVLR